MPETYRLRPGNSQLIVSIPHAGTYLPPEIAARLTPRGLAMPDTDWHVDRLYAFLEEQDVTVLTATHSRYVVDLNRDPAGALLYPGQAETGVCPTETFSGDPVYVAGAPDDAEIAARIARYWRPYHDALRGALEGARARHGAAVLFDAHSIASSVPRLFDGRLPDLNFGTNGDASADTTLAARVIAAAADQGFTRVLNGRFKGGYITRHYGRPRQGIAAIQLELAQSCYMDEAGPPMFNAGRAGKLVATLKRIIAELL